MKELKIETVKRYQPSTKSYVHHNSKPTKQSTRIGLSTMVPLAVLSPVAASASSGDGQYMTVTGDYTQTIPVNSMTQVVGEKTLETIAHALDPVIDLLVALSFPICSLVIVGSLFYLAFGNTEKCWSGVQRGALSFILIQLSPMLLDILKNVGSALA